jgi:type IV secretory pathway VirB10-like protein
VTGERAIHAITTPGLAASPEGDVMSARCATVLATFVARGSNTDIVQALRLSAVNSVNQTGQQVVRRNLNIQPTLTIRTGFPVRVIVNRDLVLEPYRG